MPVSRRAAGADGYSQQTASPAAKPMSSADLGGVGVGVGVEAEVEVEVTRRGQNAARNAVPSARAASWCPANICPYVKDSDPSAPARTQASAAGAGAPLRSRNRRIATQNSAVGTMQKTQRRMKTSAVRDGSRPSASLSAPSTGTARNDGPGAFAA